MTRRAAYFSALKAFFSEAIVDGKAPRAAYAAAKAHAALYAFTISTKALTSTFVTI